MNDIFISYAHLDDQALDEDQTGLAARLGLDLHGVSELGCTETRGRKNANAAITLENTESF